MGCVFCASGLDGVARNLTTGEIIEQIVRLASLLPADERLSHIVVMGMGEPLANLKACFRAGGGEQPSRLAQQRPGHRPSADHDLDRRPATGHRQAHRRELSLSPGRLTARPQRRAAQSPRAGEQEHRHSACASGSRSILRGQRAAAHFEYVLLGGLNDRPEHAEQLVSYSCADGPIERDSVQTPWPACRISRPRPATRSDSWRSCGGVV